MIYPVIESESDVGLRVFYQLLKQMTFIVETAANMLANIFQLYDHKSNVTDHVVLLQNRDVIASGGDTYVLTN